MNFESILPLFRQGKKIKYEDWEPDRFWKLKNGCIVDRMGGRPSIMDIYFLTDKWELYQETMTFEEAIVHYKQGKTIARVNYSWELDPNDGGINTGIEHDDILASDWIIVDK